MEVEVGAAEDFTSKSGPSLEDALHSMKKLYDLPVVSLYTSMEISSC
jgi:hypothetical protein